MTLTALSSGAVFFEAARGGERKFDNFSSATSIRADDGSLLLSADAVAYGASRDVVIMDLMSREPVVTVTPLHDKGPLRYRVFDADGDVLGGLKLERGVGDTAWAIVDADDTDLIHIVEPGRLPHPYAAETLVGARVAFVFVRGDHPIATLAEERAGAGAPKGWRKIFGMRDAAFEWVLRPRGGHTNGIDGRLLLAACLIVRSAAEPQRKAA